MKIRAYVIVFFAAFAGSLFLASCLNEENKIPPNCYDGVQNNGENLEGYIDITTGAPFFDCGGPCEPCDHCANGVFEPWLDEEWRDCGGDCAACTQCNNGVMDGNEVAIDCGGDDCPGCDQLCHDGLLNGYEDDIDCDDLLDFPDVAPCDWCPTCIDGIINGDERGIDCGGPDCEPCCSSGSCTNGYIDGAEFNTNCGGNTCYDCDSSLVWKIGSVSMYSPNNMMSKALTPNTLSFPNCIAFEVGEETGIPVGQISILITRTEAPDVPGWVYTGTQTIAFPTPAPIEHTISDYYITFIDEMGVEYSTSNLDGHGFFTLEKVATIVVPDDDFDGCNKPAGTYDYFRGSFSGTLTNVDPEMPSVQCSLGHFEVTFFTP